MRGNERQPEAAAEGDGLAITIPMRGNESVSVATGRTPVFDYDPHEG